MKGIIRHTDKGWFVEHEGKKLPVHPDDLQYLGENQELYNSGHDEVDFVDVMAGKLGRWGPMLVAKLTFKEPSGDAGYIGEDMLPDALYQKCYVTRKAVMEKYFDLKHAMEIYKVTKAQYKAFIIKEIDDLLKEPVPAIKGETIYPENLLDSMLKDLKSLWYIS